MQNIQNANTNNDVTNAKDAAINTINQLSVNPVKRKQAINELNTVAQQQNRTFKEIMKLQPKKKRKLKVKWKEN